MARQIEEFISCICDDQLLSNFQERKVFQKIFQDFIKTKSLTGDQIFNYDESGLNYKMLPSKTLAARTEAAASGYKRSKESLRILACCKATENHNMDFTVIGKYKSLKT